MVDDPLLSAAFSLYSSPGVYAVLVGSGLSRSAGVPTGWEIIQELIRSIAVLENADPGSNPTDWYRERFRRNPTYGEILARLAPTSSERRNLLRRFFERDPAEEAGSNCGPTLAHQSIARLAAEGLIRIVVTPNFDRLMEEAFTSAGVPFQVIATPDAIKGMQPLSHPGCTLLKVNGDYLDGRLKNTLGELEKYDTATTRLLERIFDEFGLIISGWSAEWDVALRTVLQRRGARRYTTYWTSRANPSASTKDLIDLLGAVPVRIEGADRFFTDLVEKTAVLKAVRAPHPLSAPMAVASLKGFIENQQQIRVHDLVSTETERLFLQLGESELLRVDLPTDAQHFRQRLDRHRSAAAVLMGLLAHGSYWADHHQQDFLGAVQRIANPPGERNGITVWINLRRYPALLLLYAVGIAAIVRGNYGLLRALLFDIVVKDGSGQKASPVKELLAHDVLDDDFTQVLFAPQKRKTPASDVLHDALRDTFRQIIPSNDDYDEAFDRLEAFMGFAHADFKPDRGWAPAGRFGWRSRDLLWSIKTEAHAAGDHWPPLRSGLFGGSLERFDKAAAAVANTSGRISWG